MQTINFKFSVIIPSYNSGKNICKTLDSLVAQTYKNFEVILSDDGSKDNTLQYAGEYSSKLNLKILSNENWGGPARPRNLGIKASSGEWIAFLDHDDFWYEDKLEEVSKLTENFDVIYHDLTIYNNTGKTGKTTRGWHLGGTPFVSLMTTGNAISNSSAVVRKSLIEQVEYIDETRELMTVEDYDLWLKIALKTNRFHYIHKSLGGYLLEPGQNMSSASARKIDRFNYIHQKYIGLLTEDQRKKSVAAVCYSKARIYHQIMDIPKALTNYQMALFSNRWSIKIKALIGIIMLFFLKIFKS